MLILLPPSEGKTPATTGDPVDLDTLWLPTLGRARRRILTKLVAMCRRRSPRSVAQSLEALGLSATQTGEVARNADLVAAPAAPAAETYAGVLYEALDLAAQTATARQWLDEQVVIFSGLWGVLRLTDRIPAYRCPVGAALPGVGGLGSYWREVLRQPLERAVSEQPVLDLRSGAYAAMWRPCGPEVASVRVLHERIIDGQTRRSVVSHFNKATKGRLLRELAATGAMPATIDEVIATLRDLKFTVEEGGRTARGSRELDVVVHEL